jgi:hypothetical protein
MQIGMQRFRGFEMGQTYSAKRIHHFVACPLPAFIYLLLRNHKLALSIITDAQNADFEKKHR